MALEGMGVGETLMWVLGLGVEPKDLSLAQVCVRAIVVFMAALAMVRLANKRFLAKMAAFDVILTFILASVLARAVNGSAPFFPTLGAGFVLVLLHRLLATMAFHSRFISFLVKGKPDVLVKDGKLNHHALKTHKLSEEDLLEEARLHGKVDSLAKIQTATIERSGEVSVIPAKGNER